MPSHKFEPVQGVKDPLAMTNFNLMARTTGSLWSSIAGLANKLAAVLKPAIIGGFSADDIRYYGGDLAVAIGAIGSESKTLFITMPTTAAATLNIPANISVIILEGGALAISAGTTTLAGYMRIYGDAAINPASGATFAMGSDAVIEAAGDWRDTSGGGSFTYAAGSWERRLLDKVTSPTGGRILHDGYPGNSIDESSGTSRVFGGSSTYPHSLGDASELSVIGGGYDNHIGDNDSASTIAGGAHHLIDDDASHSAIVGGAYQESYASYSAMVGGTLNKSYSTFGFMGGGHENTLGDPMVTPIDQRASVLVGGYQNSLKALRAVIVGGIQNLVEGAYAFLGGGRNNTASGENSVVTGGQSNVASAKNTIALGGQSNQATSLAAIVGGESATATANYAVAIGEFLDATASNAWATGSRSLANKYGQKAHAAGYFAAKGDAQISDLVARKATSGSQTVNLDLSGSTSSNPITLPNNTSWCFRIRLIGRNIDTDGENGAWTFEGALSRDANAASTALIGSVTTTTINAPSGWSVVVQADTLAGALQIQVSTDGTVSDDIRWVARIELVEASG
jgi:hypothetical protein